jgi:hypothetical protein
MFDTSRADEFVRDGLHFSGSATNHQHLHAVVLVHMHVRRADDGIQVLVLQLREHAGDFAHLVVVDNASPCPTTSPALLSHSLSTRASRMRSRIASERVR